mmetsp:Transcript_8503/g.24189  ORF Transcript_8503/g.24189 Transcript_8503/m.24189 type:complete len:286 (-) Transcript_8503:574-1431(-)
MMALLATFEGRISLMLFHFAYRRFSSLHALLPRCGWRRGWDTRPPRLWIGSGRLQGQSRSTRCPQTGGGHRCWLAPCTRSVLLPKVASGGLFNRHGGADFLEGGLLLTVQSIPRGELVEYVHQLDSIGTLAPGASGGVPSSPGVEPVEATRFGLFMRGLGAGPASSLLVGFPLALQLEVIACWELREIEVHMHELFHLEEHVLVFLVCLSFTLQSRNVLANTADRYCGLNVDAGGDTIRPEVKVAVRCCKGQGFKADFSENLGVLSATDSRAEKLRIRSIDEDAV